MSERYKSELPTLPVHSVKAVLHGALVGMRECLHDLLGEVALIEGDGGAVWEAWRKRMKAALADAEQLRQKALAAAAELDARADGRGPTSAKPQRRVRRRGQRP